VKPWPENKMSAIRNPNLGPSQMRARRRRLFFVRSSIVLFFLFIMTISLAIFSGHEKVKIQTIIVSGNAAVSSDEVLALVNRDMAGRYLYLFAKSNSLIFPRFQIKKDLLNEIKTINSVDISWEDWQTISISITERKPHSVWCGQDIKVLEQKCFFIDKGGYIYSDAPSFSGDIFIKNYGATVLDLDDISNISYIGNYFLPAATYQQIFSLIQILEQSSIKVVALSFDGYDYKFILKSGPEIIFNDKTDFALSFGNLFTAIETGNLDLVKDANIINYIDLRFDNKIVVGKK